jgi:cytochrome c-type biogenesis protein CcmH/NrfG
VELEDARRLLGDRPEILNALGECYARLNETSKALAMFRHSLSVDPTQSIARAAIEKLEQLK